MKSKRRYIDFPLMEEVVKPKEGHTMKNVLSILNGKVMSSSVNPIIENRTALVPMRTIFEELGANVTWNNEDNSISDVKGNIKVWIQEGNTTAKINNREVNLSVAPKVIDGTAYVPLESIAQTFDEKVYWNNDNDKIIIETTTIPELLWPVPGYTKVSKSFGEYYVHLELKSKKMSTGTSIPAKKGTPIVTAADDKVIMAGETSVYGHVVIIDHGEGVVTLYAHCSELLVKEKDKVKKRRRNSKDRMYRKCNGIMFIFELRYNGAFTDSEKHLKSEE